MTRTMWLGLALLCVAGLLVIARRASETKSSDPLRDAEFQSGHEEGSLEDSIDWDELEKAEDEIRDVDPHARPEDGFEGDDWGPGAAKKPPAS
jgi:hypothetical protein